MSSVLGDLRRLALSFFILGAACAPVARTVEVETAGEKAPPSRVGPGEAERRVETDRPSPSFRDPERREGILSAFEKARADFEASLDQLGAPGVSWGIVIDGELAISGARGVLRIDRPTPVTTDSVFRIGSITKVFTSVALLHLRDREKLHLDDPAERYVPALKKLVYPTGDSPPITIRQLMTHLSGLPRLGALDYATPGRSPTKPELFAGLDGLKLINVPGQTRLYSNLGAALLGPVVAQAAGEPYEAFVTRQLLKPLGMLNTVFHAEALPEPILARPHSRNPEGQLELVPEWTMGAAAAAGGLYSNVADLARFAAFQLSAWPPNSRADSPVLSRASLRESQTAVHVRRLRAEAGSSLQVHVGSQGLGWSTYQDCRFSEVVWHNGGTEGHQAALYLLPRRGVAAIVLANRNGADVDTPLRELLEALHDAGVLPERQRPVALPADWRSQVAKVLALPPDLSAADYEHLFSEPFRKAIPLVAARRAISNIRASHGECRVAEGVDDARAPWRAAYLDCSISAGVVEAALGYDGRFAGLRVLSTDEFEARSRPSACRNAAPP